MTYFCLFVFGVFFLIEVWLIYNVVLVSGVQPSDSVKHLCISIPRHTFSIIIPYKILNRVPCAIQSVLIGYLFYT